MLLTSFVTTYGHFSALPSYKKQMHNTIFNQRTHSTYTHAYAHKLNYSIYNKTCSVTQSWVSVAKSHWLS